METTAAPLNDIPELVHLAKMTAEERYATLRGVYEKGEAIQLFDFNETAWPTRTSEKCRWCLHGFHWMPLGVPTRWDEKRKKMVLRGHFCSFACTLAYCYERSTQANSSEKVYWLILLAKRAFGLQKINRAPPREMLSRCTIEEFRAMSVEAEYSDPCVADLFVREPEIIDVKNLRKRSKDEAIQQQSSSQEVIVSLPTPTEVRDRQLRHQRSGGVLNLLGATPRRAKS